MKTEYNPEQKGVSKTTGCIIAMVVLLFCFPLVIMFMDGLIHMYQDSPIRGKTIFIGIILCIICHATIIILKTVKLHKVVDNGTAIRKHVKVIDFKFANKNGGEDETTHGYYVITSDGENNYKGMFHRGAKIYGKSEEDLINDEFYREEGITLNLTNKDITRQQLDQKISSLEAEGEYANFFKKGKLFLEIEKMKKRKHDLEPYHLHTYEGDFYIGDEYVLLVDPDDSNNYIFEKDNV